MEDSHPIFLALMLGFLCLLGGGPLRAETDASAKITLQPNPASVGETVQLDLTVTGTSRTGDPPAIQAQGAYVEYQGQQTRFQATNGLITQEVIHTYRLVPQRNGTITVPAQKIRVGTEFVEAASATLSVTSNPGRETAARDAFAEWVFPKSTLFIGEPLPAELRLYLAADIRWDLQGVQPMSGEGFTVQKLFRNEEPVDVERDGRRYHLVIFRTALTAVKTGTISIAPSDISLIAMRRDTRSQRRTIPRGGIHDLFEDDFFNQFGSVRREQVTLKTTPTTLEVQPLPVKDRPAGFSGAVGQFTLSSRATPGRVNLGDPVTLTVEISGKGSFDRMTPPEFKAEGWRAYPPSTEFEKEDETGTSGKKRFEYAVIPEKPATELPGVTFSYFDPVKEAYVTLTGEAIPIVVEGTTPPATAATSPGAAAAQPTPGAEANEDDLLPPLYVNAPHPQTFTPGWQHPLFWAVQALPLLAFLALLGWQRQQRRLGDVEGRRIAAMRAQRQEALRAMKHGGEEPAFLNAAVRAFQLEAALHLAASGVVRQPETVDIDTICREFALDEAACEEIRAVFAAHDRLRYAGGEAGGTLFPPQRRADLLRTLDTLSHKA